MQTKNWPIISAIILGVICFGFGGVVLVAKSKDYFQKSKANDNLALFDLTNLDSDGDGLSDKKEMELNTNPYSEDSDGDGWSDAEEVRTGHDPLKIESFDLVDLDGDGLIGKDEEKYGTNPKKADTDYDGYSDGDEIVTGHDPLSANFSHLDPFLENAREQQKEQSTTSTCSTGSCLAEGGGLNLSNFTSSSLENIFNAKSAQDLQVSLFSALGLDQTKLNFNQQITLPQISNERLKIGSKSGKQAGQNYFNSVGIILYKNSPVHSLKEAESYVQEIDIRNPRDIDKILEIVDKIISDFQNLEVPNDQKIIDFHKKILGAALFLQSAVFPLKNIKYESKDDFYTLTNVFSQVSALNNLVFDQILPEAEKIAQEEGFELPTKEWVAQNS